MANKRKTTTVLVAGVTALALLLGGTFAWTSIQQEAKNEAIVDINPGGRLHDDFNGTNKDVYVENFSSGATGVNIFARIRLDQYFEVGQDAGINKDGTDRKVNQVLGTDINDVETWVTYKPGESLTAPVQANDNWQWTLGNDDTNKPYYMPTFNMNKDSLAADINGTYEGTTEGDIVHYDDYLVYVDADGNPKTVTGTEVYDWDDEDNDEEETPNITYDETTPRDSADVYHKENQTHTATQISSTATVYTMAEWIAQGSPIGPYWVYDTDGWAYWAQAIEPGKTTGLLLDSISMSKVPDDNYYYGINVVGQFATAGDIYQFEDMSDAAKELFVAVSGLEEIVISGDDTIYAGGTATYTAVRNIFGETAGTQPSFTWSVNEIEGVTMENGTLTVADTVAAGTKITVTATAGDGTATADGETTVLAGTKTVIVEGTLDITAAGSTTRYTTGTELTETFTANLKGATETDGTVTWTVADSEGNALTHTTITDGSLTIGAEETAWKVVVTATYKSNDGKVEFSGTYEILSTTEIVTTDSQDAQLYALQIPNGTNDAGEATYKLVFVHSEDEITASNTYNGTPIADSWLEEDFMVYLWKDLLITEAYFDNVYWDGDMKQLFRGMTNLEKVNASKLDTSKVEGIYGLFYGCVSLKTIEGIENWDVSSVTNMQVMFYNCDLLTLEGIENWDVSSVTNMTRMFAGCDLLTLDCSKWNVSNVTEYSEFNENAPGVIAPTWSN